MHIPDGFLTPGTAVSTWAVAAGSIALALREERRSVERVSPGVLGSVAAFVFAAQMINVPVAPGTSGHLVGATLAAVLLGPWRASLAMAAVLAVQALLFQDGGITAFGANFIDMGLCGPIVGFAVARLAGRVVSGPRGAVVGGVLGAFAATLTGATLVAIWLALSGLYPFSGVLPVLLVTHVPIGLLEAALTGAILVTLVSRRPDLAASLVDRGRERRPAVIAAGVFGAAVSVAIVLAPFASSLPDGLEKTAAALGFAARAHPFWPAGLPGHGTGWERLAFLAPAVTGTIGTAAAAVLAWAISRSLALRGDDAHR